MKVYNCMPHAVALYREGVKAKEYPPSGVVWRLKESDVPLTSLELDDIVVDIVQRKYSVDELVSLFSQTYTEPSLVIVSLPLLLGLGTEVVWKLWAQDIYVVAPDTGAGGVRDEKGNIIGTTRFVTL